MENTEPISFKIALPGRLAQLINSSLEAFEQTDPLLVARPLGVDIESCKIACSVGKRLLKEQELFLLEVEVKALLFLMTFAERELCSEIHLQMQDLQKKMATIVISRSAKEIDKLAGELPKEAEKAMRGLKSVLKNRGELLDECQAFIKKLKSRSK